ncbi:MAG: beta strand repeat-containing protein, partial [Pseudomonadales bacterium]
GVAGVEITAKEFVVEQVGANVSSAGDINGDGFDDVIITNNRGGYTFVVFGTDETFVSLDVGDLDGSNGFAIEDADESISGGGDINGDGFDDLIIQGDNGAYVLFGSEDISSVVGSFDFSYTRSGYYPGYGNYSFTTNFDDSITALNPDNDVESANGKGFQIVRDSNADDADDYRVAIIGDINGDGYDDFILSNYEYEEGVTGVGGGGGEGGEGGGEGGEGGDSEEVTPIGKAWVVFGGEDVGSSGRIELKNLDGTNGFAITGESVYELGYSLAGAGDIDGDGFDDFLLSETGRNPDDGEGGEGGEGSTPDPSDYQGEAYIFFGSDFAGAAGVIGTSGNDQLTADASGVVKAGSGSDTITVAATDFFRIDGGGGSDTLTLGGSGLTLDFSNLQQRAVRNIESINLTGSGNNTLTINHAQAKDVLGGGAGTLQITGNAGDVVNVVRAGVKNNDGFNTTYTKNNVVISISNAVTIVEQEIAPVFVTGTAFDLAENTTLVTDFFARDANGDTITYGINGGADASFFSIDTTTGELSFDASPDFETPQGDVPGAPGANDNAYVVNVTATDTTGRTTTQAVTVTVTDVNEAPTITSSTGSNVISLSNPSGLTTVSFTTTDPESEAVTLVASGADFSTDKFFLTGSTLQAKFLGPDADANGDGVYELTLTATDASGASTTLDLFIGVLTDGVNGVPIFEQGSNAEVTITEGDTAVGTFTAIEADGQDLTYSLTGGDDDADFSIDPSTGALSFNSAPSYVDGTTEGENTYRVTVTANDGAGGTKDLIVDVTVAYDVTTTPATLTNFNSNYATGGSFGDRGTNEAGEILDFSNLFTGVSNAPETMEQAFDEGWLNFRRDGSDVVIQFDSDGGGDDYVDILTLTNGSNKFIDEEFDNDLFLI